MSSLSGTCGSCNGKAREHEELPESPDSINPQFCRQCLLTGDRCQPCAQLVEAGRRVQDAKAALVSVVEQERQLKFKLNLRNDPFNQLPIEVACRIFVLCIPESPTIEGLKDHPHHWVNFDYTMWKMPSQLTLGAICQTWRRVVWSYPRFWNSPAILVGENGSPSLVSLLEEWLSRSGQLPLFMRVCFLQNWDKQLDPTVSSQRLNRLISVLNSVTHRWCLFRAEIPSSCMKQLRLPVEAQINLQGLILKPAEKLSGFHSGRFDLGVEVSPSIFVAERLRLQNVRLQCGNLTQFIGGYMEAADCVKIISQAPQLRKCTLQFLLNADAPLSPPIVHPILKYLNINGHPGIFNHLTLPALRELHCDLSEGSTLSALLRFIARSSCPLEIVILGVRKQSNEDEDLLEFLRLTPSLKQLDLFGMEAGETLIQELGATSFALPNDVAAQLLPNLQSIHLASMCRDPWAHVAAIASTTPPREGMIRRPLSKIDFSVIEGDPDDPDLGYEDWVELIDRESLAIILNAIHDGVALKIWDEYVEGIIKISQDFYATRKELDREMSTDDE